MAVFSFLHPGRCTYVYMLHARLYYDTCVPLHRPVCTYTFATRMTTLRTLRPGLDCQALPCVRRCSWWVPAVRGRIVFLDALPCVRRCNWWVPADRRKCFFAKYGFTSSGSPLLGGGIIILHVIRRHFLVCGCGPAVSLSTYSPRPMDVIR